MKKTFYNRTDIDASRKLIDDATETNIKEGTVISVSSSEVRVQIEGNRFQSAYAPKGITVEQGDRVMLIRSPRNSRWVVMAAYVNPQAAGNVTGSTPATMALAPSSLTIVPLVNGFLARCVVGVDTPIVFEFEVADDTAETNAVNLLVAGSILPYSSVTTKQVRVRVIDSKWNKSGWTGWVAATPTPGVLAVTASAPLASSGGSSPNISLTGLVPLTKGGTHTDLSTTGPGFALQTGVGSDFTIRPLVQADLPVFTGDSGSGGVKGAVPAPTAGDSAASKYLSAAGSWQTLNFNTILTDEDGLILVDLDGNVLTE